MQDHESDQVFGEVVLRYTLREAEEDGVLVNILGIWERSLISHVTSNLLSRGYITRKADGSSELNMPNLVDLLNQTIQEIKKQSPGDRVSDRVSDRVRGFYSFRVELPDGSRRLLFAAKNELGRLTLMLPEDY